MSRSFSGTYVWAYFPAVAPLAYGCCNYNQKQGLPTIIEHTTGSVGVKQAAIAKDAVNVNGRNNP